jgi:tetratricopeptide (TPR) repeat protein
MYYFSLNDYEGAIADLQIAMKIDSLSNVDRKLQISLMYLLSNNLDSSLYYLNMALGDISGMHEYDLEEFLKESNLLNALIHYKMENLNAACIYFQEYNKFNNVEIYTNYLPEFFAQRDLSGTTLYRDLFRIDMEHLTNVCK